MKTAFKVVELIGRIMALVLVGSLFYGAVKADMYPMALGLAIVFLFLSKMDGLDKVKFNLKNKTLEMEDGSDKK